MSTAPLHLYVNIPGHTLCFATITAALDSLPPAAGQEKKYPAPISALPPAILHIGSGTYRERLVITRPNLILCGEGNTPSDVTIVWGDAAFDEMPEGDRLV